MLHSPTQQACSLFYFSIYFYHFIVMQSTWWSVADLDFELSVCVCVCVCVGGGVQF